MDVRLTMGGEPTFVSIDDYEASEWTTAALGPRQGRARRRTDPPSCASASRPGGLLHYGQGKWYPGEPLPRWAYALYWRKDGLPVWHDAELIASGPAATKPTDDDARGLALGIAARLGLASDFVQATYEDPLDRLVRDGELPENIDPADPKLDDPAERGRILRALEKRLTEPAGYVLPLMALPRPSWAALASPGWQSEIWRVRRGRLFLLPRRFAAWLPAAAVVAAGDRQGRRVLSGSRRSDGPAAQSARPAHAAADRARRGASPRRSRPPHRRSRSTRRCATALTVESRNGRLCVFMPPTERLEDYLAIVTAVEATRRRTRPRHPGRRLRAAAGPAHQRHQGDARPRRHRSQHPSGGKTGPRRSRSPTGSMTTPARRGSAPTSSWLTAATAAPAAGNHVVLGGPNPANSPFLRRPDLLKSLVLYWQAPPVLVLPVLRPVHRSDQPGAAHRRSPPGHASTSSRPLSLWCRRPGDGEPPAPWLVDRLFRNLLVDVTGNTHRAEICIDKLFSPDGPAGRLGLIEFRSFEMPPDARMSLAQQLLLRALVAWFWREPLDGTAVRWGTALHDRFMLEHFVWTDFLEVLDDLAREGYRFDPAWFEAQREFRFPLYGSVHHGSVRLELRHALEPWHVLGEEGAAGGTVRFVDSSVERLQVKVSGLAEGRHMITCNGRRLPLVSTGRPGEAVAGVRFKAWSLPASLHPTVPVNAPLTFDIVDAWNRRSLGGCVYHVAHPGGRNYESAPVNSYEAEARRRARFQDHGHTPGTIEPLPAETHSMEYPTTLDLRRS